MKEMNCLQIHAHNLTEGKKTKKNFILYEKLQTKIRNLHTTAAIYNIPLGGKRTIGSIPQNLEIYAQISRAWESCSGSWSLYSTELKNQKGVSLIPPWKVAHSVSLFFALKQTGQLPLPTAELLKGPSLWTLQCYTWQSPITANARLRPITWPDTNSCLTVKNHNSPHNSQAFFLAVTLKACQKEGRSKQRQVDLFLISILILLKAALCCTVHLLKVVPSHNWTQDGDYLN